MKKFYNYYLNHKNKNEHKNKINKKEMICGIFLLGSKNKVILISPSPKFKYLALEIKEISGILISAKMLMGGLWQIIKFINKIKKDFQNTMGNQIKWTMI
jgi:hypothetical protein